MIDSIIRRGRRAGTFQRWQRMVSQTFVDLLSQSAHKKPPRCAAHRGYNSPTGRHGALYKHAGDRQTGALNAGHVAGRRMAVPSQPCHQAKCFLSPSATCSDPPTDSCRQRACLRRPSGREGGWDGRQSMMSQCRCHLRPASVYLPFVIPPPPRRGH